MEFQQKVTPSVRCTQQHGSKAGVDFTRDLPLPSAPALKVTKRRSRCPGRAQSLLLPFEVRCKKFGCILGEERGLCRTEGNALFRRPSLGGVKGEAEFAERKGRGAGAVGAGQQRVGLRGEQLKETELEFMNSGQNSRMF